MVIQASEYVGQNNRKTVSQRKNLQNTEVNSSFRNSIFHLAYKTLTKIRITHSYLFFQIKASYFRIGYLTLKLYMYTICYTKFYIKGTKKMKNLLKVLLFASVFFFLSCTNKKDDNSKKIGVFVPGIVSGSPVYEMLVAGITEAVDSFNETASQKVSVDVIEAGTNQAEWNKKMTAIVSTGKYSLIISSNPSLPEIVAPLTEQFPRQKFIILDSYMAGNPSIATARYNQREQAYINGYISALVTTADSSKMKYANGEKKIALLAAQEYPVMNSIIFPSFVEGAKAIEPDINVEFCVVGNWYDASKSSELAHLLYQKGVDVIMPVSGGANQGVLAKAQEDGFYVAWFDDNGFSKAPGNVISSAVLNQKRMAFEMTKDFLESKVVFGHAVTVGIKEGFVDFIEDDENYINTVSEDIRDKMSTLMKDLKDGKILLPSPEL